jgi:hypothetical protein
MAKDGINIQLEGGARLDRVLQQLDVAKSGQGSRIINSSLKKASEAVRTSVANKAPTAQNKTYKNPNKMGSRGGKSFASRNHKRGTLRRSIKARLSHRARPNINTFIASVYVQDGHKKKAPVNEDGWYAFFLQNANKYSGMPSAYKANDFMKKGTKAAKGTFKRIMEVQMLGKITRAQKKLIKQGLL